MNAIRVPLVGLALCALLAVGLVAADLAKDLESLAEQGDNGPVFDEDQDGYDKHADIFYYLDSAVDKEYDRKNYMATKITMGGQKPDPTLRAVKPAVYPFAVGQRSFKQFGTFMDRWDVKDTGKDVQYLALYHGSGNANVVNKVRAHLLRELANAVSDSLPSLERLAEPDAAGHEDLKSAVLETIRATIERVFREVDKNVSKTGSASATIAIVTKNWVISAGVGGGRIIAYGDNYETSSLTEYEDDPSLMNLFGAKRTRNDIVHPHVEFYPREENGYQFILIESEATANNVDDEAATRIVTSEIDTHKYVENEEQEIYSGSIVRVLNLIESSLHPLKRFFFHSDYSAILVGLNTDYENIH